jgi:hypothetical protein
MIFKFIRGVRKFIQYFLPTTTNVIENIDYKTVE